MSALTECPKCGEQVQWMGDASEINEDDVIVDGYCTADTGCEANWVKKNNIMPAEMREALAD